MSVTIVLFVSKIISQTKANGKHSLELTVAALKDNDIVNPLVVTSDGVDALEYLRYEGKYKDRKKGNPCMVMLDIKMPRMNGLEFLSIVKKDVKLKRIPIIILTCSREEKDVFMGYDLGVNAYIVKPVDYDDFKDVVKQIGSFWAIVNEMPPN